MNKNAKLWVEALRSGRYTKTEDQLMERKKGRNKFCVLGVAMDLAVRHGVIPKPTFKYGTGYFGGKEMEVAELTEPVRKWLGLKTTTGDFKPDTKIPSESHNLMELNDSCGWKFKKFADFIESEPKGLFVPERKRKPKQKVKAKTQKQWNQNVDLLDETKTHVRQFR